jgi:apolipoprotein N-acyltransferase
MVILILIVIVGSVVTLDILVAREQPIGHIKVGAIGWLFPQAERDIGDVYAKSVADAASQGVQLLVSPETAFGVNDDNIPQALVQFRDLSRQHGIHLAVGYFDAKSSENRAAFINPTDGLVGRYTKTHLTPFEHYAKGNGQPVIVVIDGVSVGVMICQDDNYTDISRQYGVQPTAVVAVPTNDWITVRNAHLQNTIHRAIESRFAIVRAASNGISAIISPKGKLLVIKDHFTDGPGLIVADVPIYGQRTVFSRFGHWFVAVCGVFLACYVWGMVVAAHRPKGGVQ